MPSLPPSESTSRVWDVETGEARFRLSGTGGVHQLAFSEAARALAVCAYGRDVSLFGLTFRAPAARELERIRGLLGKLDDDSYDLREATSKELLDVGFVAEGELSRAAKEGKSVEVRLRARRLRQEMLSAPRARLRGHTAEVESVAFSAEGKLLASGGKDGTVRLWDLSALRETARRVAAKGPGKATPHRSGGLRLPSRARLPEPAPAQGE